MSQRLNANGLTPDAWEVVLAHQWPFNLSELYSVLQAPPRPPKGELIDGTDLPFPLRQAVKLQKCAADPSATFSNSTRFSNRSSVA